MTHILKRRESKTNTTNEGLTVMQEVDDLNAGLTDTIKAVAEEMQTQTPCTKESNAHSIQSRLRKSY